MLNNDTDLNASPEPKFARFSLTFESLEPPTTIVAIVNAGKADATFSYRNLRCPGDGLEATARSANFDMQSTHPQRRNIERKILLEKVKNVSS